MSEPQKISDEQIDALLDADDISGEKNSLRIFARIHERRRKRAHAAAKATQPALGVRDLPQHAELMGKVNEFFRTPLTSSDGENTAGVMTYLLLTVQDTIEAGDLEDTLFAALRVVRKAWALNATQLGPIEGVNTAK